MIDKKAPLKPLALGRGLGALIPGGSPSERRGVVQLGIEEIAPDKHNPRRKFDEKHVEELAESIRSKGVLQPVLVRRGPSGYVLIAGERRWRAAQKAGLRELPALVKEVTESEAFELALIENIQREDLNPIEESEAYDRLIGEHKLTQEQLAERVGKDRSTIANSLRLLRLPEMIKMSIVSGTLSMGHARALLGIADAEELERAARKVMDEGLSVRAVEALVQRMKGGQSAKKTKAEGGNVHVKQLVEKLQRKLGAKVELKDKGGKGTVEIRYESNEDLDRVLAVILG
ncbi:MAG: ParB/RepB/Spo0J family partition protein [Deltaproteobacteria bacterium]|nr:ParB/RepB/Spo0J family partition protein [Deltaproteobacteria bacterium]